MGAYQKINILKKLPAEIDPITVIDAKSGDFDTIANLTTVACDGFTKLLVHYKCSSGWDRAGTIKIYGAFTDDDNEYVLADATVENGSFDVGTGDTGEWYVVENVMPFIKVGLDITTAGTTGTITVKVLPFNE